MQTVFQHFIISIKSPFIKSTPAAWELSEVSVWGLSKSQVLFLILHDSDRKNVKFGAKTA